MSLQLKRLRQEIQATIANLSEDQWKHRPQGKWSQADVLEHLYLTYTGTLKGFSRMMEAGQPQVSRPTWKQRVARIGVVGLGYLPTGREAPSFARPKGAEPEHVRSEILNKIAEMDAQIARCEEQFGRHTPLLDHVILGPLTGEQWRKFHLVHGRHHLKQIRQRIGS